MTEEEIKRIIEEELKRYKHSKDLSACLSAGRRQASLTRQAGKHAFCRYHLKEVMKDVKKQVPVEIRKTACVMGDYGHYSFYINHPQVGFYVPVAACCKWAARSAGWSKYLGKIEDDADELNSSI